MLLGGQNNGTFVSNLGTDTFRGTNRSLFLGTTNSTSGRSNVISDLNSSLSNVIGIGTNNNLLSNLEFAGFNSIGDSFM
ncbi:hypothetical protein GXM_02458 [Nostoc sphaeroides CCNUC1]|uniref:Uncharacterized protein n=1 Tax=Nostoc sphaeroides CCNUC1 TaxID=2653204 RepID=A0A5P8VX27_9NOSO|nr:hypothetical protein GXM_02458 [Nostoc sphaeroides CCNUC1]